MKTGHIKTTIDLPERIYYELKAASLLSGRLMTDIISQGLAKRVERIVDKHDGPIESEAMELMEKVYAMRREENHLSEVQQETLRKLREG